MEEQEVGKITHYYNHLGVAALTVTQGELKVGDTIHIRGAHSDFTQKLESIQIEHGNVESAKVGDDIGIKVIEHAREHDTVYKVVE